MRSIKSSILVTIIVFVVFNIVAFVIPSSRSETFWISYAFTVAMFVLTLINMIRILKANMDLKSRVLHLPIIIVTYLYVIIQIFVFFLFFAIQNTLPTWVSIIVCTIILGAALVLSIITESTVSYADQVDKKVGQKVYNIKSLQADVELIADAENDSSLKKVIEDLAEKIRFSDPMSHESLSAIEGQISDAVARLKTANNDEKNNIVTEIDRLITERNKKCKLLK